jgi:succinoglycan biosynthesis protein ExoM
MNVPHITVCICTCGRHALLNRLLHELARQKTEGAFTFSVVVIDNDVSNPARQVVETCRRETPLTIGYAIEPERNIAVARNAAVARATGEFAVFIDDDEFPVRSWLLHLFRTCEAHQAAGVLGPVLPHFDRQPARWVIKGGFYDRPTHPTAFLLPWHECRTGNVLFRRTILNSAEEPFRREFGTGGEDQDFFRRQIERGHRFIWCNEAVAYEVVPPERWSCRFLLSRALLRGKNTFRHPRGRVRNLLKSFLAVPLYVCALPFLLMLGFEHFMRYLIKLADHVGRLLALFGINPVRVRRM